MSGKLVILVAAFLAACGESETGSQAARKSTPKGATKAVESVYNSDITLAYTSVGLTKADLAWHALNTYGWDCRDVVSVAEDIGDFYIITCRSRVQLRVYPRWGQHPRITNIRGTYE